MCAGFGGTPMRPTVAAGVRRLRPACRWRLVRPAPKRSSAVAPRARSLLARSSGVAPTLASPRLSHKGVRELTRGDNCRAQAHAGALVPLARRFAAISAQLSRLRVCATVPTEAVARAKGSPFEQAQRRPSLGHPDDSIRGITPTCCNMPSTSLSDHFSTNLPSAMR